MSKLFSDDEGSVHGGDHQITINEHYAKAFEYRKEREELERLKAKYGSDYDPDASDFSTDSESDESEDEHGEELTPAVDAAILRTLARIKKKDPAIYDTQKDIFGEEKDKVGSTTKPSANGQTKSKSKSKPVTLRQVNLEAMLNASRSPSPEEERRPLTHAEEQEALRKETIAAFHGAVAETGDDEFLIPREKTKDEREREEEEYRTFLEREVGDLRELVSVDGNDDSEEEHRINGEVDEGEQKEEKKEGASNEPKKKKKKKTKKLAGGGEPETVKKTKAEKDQDFLLNYILNRGWIDRSEGHVPTYNEVTSPAQERRKKKGKSKAEPQDVDLETMNGEEGDEEMDTGLLSDTSFESLASHFEASYNHRFEEPGAATIPSFPRNLPSVVRRQDTTRKDARERRKQRKEEELQKKREDVKRLKALKMREVKRKLDLIGRQGGLKKNDNGGDGEEDDFVDEALRELDLEGEWDPEKHDRQMAGLFDRGAEAFEDEGDFDQDEVDDGVKYDENGKPVWDDDVDIGDIPISDDDANIVVDANPKISKKEKKKKKKKKEGEEDGGVDVDAMDADVAPQFDDDEEWDGTEEMRKRKFNQYMDEIYGLDFNDMVGDLPTRFKYVPIQSQAYSLTPAEILMATDQELNEYMSVKKYAPYRQEKADRHRWNPKAQEKLHELKTKIGERAGTTFASGSGGRRHVEDGQGEKVKKRMGKKERMKLKSALGEAAAADVTTHEDGPESTAVYRDGLNNQKSKKRKREEGQGGLDEERSVRHGDGLEANGEGAESAAKKKRKRRQRKKESEGETAQA
ncbi:KRI1-like family C-terminal-domain-containing protein [Flammula alnicola]|nr:KRI1-like family C-terminal-domain-containing protein [Flammula alnicola]